MHFIREHIPFFSSVFVGILVWMLVFLLFPARVVSPLSWESLGFIVASYSALIAGYLIFPKGKELKVQEQRKWTKKEVYLMLIFIVCCFIVRYIDLFIIRGASFRNSVWENRALLEQTKPGFFLIFVSVCKQLYFIPIILLLKENMKGRSIMVLSIVVFILPFIEGAIRGSRNSFFIPAILLLFIFIYFKKIRLNKRQLVLMGAVVTLLFVIATSIIVSREQPRTDENYSSITTDFILNDFLEPYPEVFEKIHSTESKTMKKFMVSGFQVGQYYVHGVFEFNHLVKYYKRVPLQKQYGKYTFATIVRFANKCGLTNINLSEIQAKHPRGYTFITFFGGIYIDFGWLGVLIMFLFGALQRKIANAINMKKIEYIPLAIFFLFVNFFMLTFNFIENTGTYFLTVCSGFILFSNREKIFQRFLKRKEKEA